MFVLRKGRNPIGVLFPLLRKVRPRRGAISGETEKHQTPYPPAWMNTHQDFNNPKKFPMEIDHIDGNPSNAWPGNLRWLTKLHHIERTQQQLFPFRRKRRKGTPSVRIGRIASWD